MPDEQTASPEILDTPLPEIESAPQEAPAETIPTTIERPGEGGSPLWLFAVLAFLATGGLAFFFLRRRGGEEAVGDFEETVGDELPEAGVAVGEEPVEPAPPPPPSPTEPRAQVPPPPVPEPAVSAKEATKAPARVAIDFVPLVARFTPAGLAVSYRLHVENICNEDVSDVSVCLAIRGADHGAMEKAVERGTPCVTLDALPVNRRAVHEGEILLDAAAIRPLRIEGKLMLVPIIDLMPCYRDGEGQVHEHHAALLLGRENDPPTAKMAPFRLDGGFSQFGKLGCRMLRAGEPNRAAA